MLSRTLFHMRIYKLLRYKGSKQKVLPHLVKQTDITWPMTSYGNLKVLKGLIHRTVNTAIGLVALFFCVCALLFFRQGERQSFLCCILTQGHNIYIYI